MMKHFLLVLLMIAISNTISAQDYMDEIAAKACDCLNTIADTLDQERYNMELGLCMLSAAEPYKKKLKKDYNIDFKKIDKQGEELGQIIGMRMASVCPEGLLKLVNQVNGDDEIEVSEDVFEGRITNINTNIFVEFSVKDEPGKITKFYWLTFIESDFELSSDYMELEDKLVRISFFTQEFFDARIGEYRNFNIIQELDVITE